VKRPNAKKRRTRAQVYNRVEWPSTEEGWCQWFRDLDERYDTEPGSPLHHDGRCPLHKVDRR